MEQVAAAVGTSAWSSGAAVVAEASALATSARSACAVGEGLGERERQGYLVFLGGPVE